MGVKILWLMPIHPIGVKNRKEGLGSYYSVKDYRGSNPEFGNLDDYKNLVKTAHQNGMYVIMDWVPNHTAWDHAWVTEHPEYYAKDKDGKMISPFDWTDVVKLDYSNQNLRRAMVDEMKYSVFVFCCCGYPLRLLVLLFILFLLPSSPSLSRLFFSSSSSSSQFYSLLPVLAEQ